MEFYSMIFCRVKVAVQPITIPGVRYAAIARRSQVSALSQLLETKCSLSRGPKKPIQP